MRRIIPVIVHHEGYSSYLKPCINSAEKYNEKVILLGNEENKSITKNWENVADFDSEDWSRFEKVFCNMSTYPDKWAVQIYRRFFIIKKLMEVKGHTECILLDSDVVTFENYSNLDLWADCDASLFIKNIEEQEQDYIWAASANTSYLSYAMLCEFIEYLIDTYKNNIGPLEEKWKYHLENNVPGGVCEMTLLYLWYKTTDKKVVNTDDIFGAKNKRYAIGNDVKTKTKKCPFIMNKILQIEKIVFGNDNKPSLITENNEYVKAVCVHFCGMTKAYMDAYNTDNRFLRNIKICAMRIYIISYTLLAKIYIFLKKEVLKK